MKNGRFRGGPQAVIGGIAAFGLSFVAIAAAAQAPEDGVLATCAAQGNANDVCICASLMLHARLGDQSYDRFGEISNRITEIEDGAAADEGETDRLTTEGFRFFLPHGQAISVCKRKLAAGG